MSEPNPLRKFDVTAQQIDAVVAKFYAEVRMHPVLGPVFSAHVENWPEHEEKIARFWRNAILREKCYSGNPMQVHVTRHDIKEEHFPLWLSLFHDVLHLSLPEDIAKPWSALADRIGQGFRVGVSSIRQKKNEVPSLF